MRRIYIKPEILTVIVKSENIMGAASEVLPIDKDQMIYDDNHTGAQGASIWDENE